MRQLMPVIVVSLLVAAGCNRKVAEVITSDIDRTNYKVESIITDTLAYISRGHCFGRCPVYETTIFNNGIVLYKGIANVERTGLHHSRLSQLQLDALIDSALALNYFKLNDTFPTGQVRIADLPTTHTMVQVNADRHAIVNRNFESMDNTASYKQWLALMRFEDFIDATVAALKFERVEQLKTED
jgi:hypothetical protein